jgi:hypothetical protein
MLILSDVNCPLIYSGYLNNFCFIACKNIIYASPKDWFFQRGDIFFENIIALNISSKGVTYMVDAFYASVKVPQWYAAQGSDTTMSII